MLVQGRRGACGRVVGWEVGSMWEGRRGEEGSMWEGRRVGGGEHVGGS